MEIVELRVGLCPNVQRAHFERVITLEMMRPGMTEADLNNIAAAFHKVWRALPALREIGNAA